MAKVPTAKRYAVALFELACEQGKEEAWLEGLSHASDALQDPTVGEFFSQPQVPEERKREAVGHLVPNADQLVLNFLGLLVERQATTLLPAILQAYGVLLNDHLGRVRADITSAAPVSPDQIEKLNGVLSDLLKQEVILGIVEDPSIVGGIVVRIGDRIIDGSVRTRLENLRAKLDKDSLS